MGQNLLAAIPQEHTRFTQLPNEQGHNAVWDFVRSPDNRFFVTVCGENEKPLTALLYEYYPDTGELRHIFDVADVWIIDKEQMPPSKIHTSIDFLPDGRLIMATHNTAPAPAHKQWMFEQHYEDQWEGYPGSILMIVDPDTNDVQVRGIPVPRESIYGGMLGTDPRYYYFLGYMKGHLYRLDLQTNEVVDYGKTTEFSSCRLVKDDKGRFYGSSYTGGFWRFDPERGEIEDLKVSFLSPHGTKHRRQFIFALHSPRGTIFMVDNMDGEVIELHPDTLEATRHGYIHLRDHPPVNPCGIGGLAADENFVLYYGLKTHDEYCPLRLIRWDILNGGEPENLGLVTPDGKDSQYICEMIFDDKGWLHMVDVCGQFSPYILAVDTKKLNVPGADAEAAQIHPYYEPDYNGVGAPAFMHIQAAGVRTLPLHQHMAWRDTAVSHMRIIGDKLYTITGKDCIYLVESGRMEGTPGQIRKVYEDGAPVSAVDLDGDQIAVLAVDGHIVTVDVKAGTAQEAVKNSGLIKLHGRLKHHELLASDQDGKVYTCDLQTGQLHLLRGIELASAEQALIMLGNDRLLLSDGNDGLLLYDIAAGRAETLGIRAPSIRGRAFKAMVTGGVCLADGTVVAGTFDGMLFTIAPDLQRTTVYGRMFSTGMLRHFVRRNDDEVWGVYGSERDISHLFHFSRERGFVDYGRPRVIKDNAELRDLDTEWACIHYISTLAYAPEHDWLCIGSGEHYGCVVQYEQAVAPC
ncbi:hypothetical protein [Paenibacillus sp. GCM10027626]|uniref:hypothetical protein n=1 Tax=Paenibacillus sp. GCM10027626 TaxID=3273411 RepID=UPI003632EE49